MNPKLKMNLLKISKVSVKVITWGAFATGIATYLMQFLPPETYVEVVNIINASKEQIATYSTSTMISSGGVLVGLQALKMVNSSLSETDLKIQTIETKLKKDINRELKVHADLDERVVDGNNIIIANQQKLLKLDQAKVSFDIITAKRYLAMSDDIVPPPVKEMYRNWLDNEVKALDLDVKPITKIIEVKEIIEKTVELKNGKRNSW